MRAWVTLATNDTDEMDASGRFYGQYLGSHMRIHLNDRSSPAHVPKIVKLPRQIGSSAAGLGGK